jgi:putative heme iron utilization protein
LRSAATPACYNRRCDFFNPLFFRKTPMPHESRLTVELRALLHSSRVAALGTLGDDGRPFVSMVPYALAPSLGCLVIHVSGLAAHTGNLLARPEVSLLVMRAEEAGQPVHALPRVTLDGLASVLESGSEAWQACRAAYVARFPEAEFMTQLGDFRFVAIAPSAARQIAGFGAARSIDAQELKRALESAGP